jgi:hypothetical protein
MFILEQNKLSCAICLFIIMNRLFVIVFFFFMARCSALMLLTLGAAAAFAPAPRMFSVKRRSHTRQCADLRMHHVRIQRVCVCICVCVCIYISS